MEYISIRQAAEKWNITLRRVQEMCKSGRIEGAAHFGRAWMIPADTQKPVDGRTKTAKEQKSPSDGLPHLPMPRKNPLLIYTDLYNTPGTADSVIESLADQPEAARLLRSQVDYHRGNIDQIAENTQYFLRAHSGFNAVVGEGIILAMCAMWRGDIGMWRQARQHIYEAPCHDDEDRRALDFWRITIDNAISDTADFPHWFRCGIFDCLPADSYCAARVFYVKYLYIAADKVAKGELKLDYVEGLGLMRTLPHFIEPMICQARVERTLLPEIYLHLMAGVAYHHLGDDAKAIPHIDKAIELCIPDGLLVSLVEYRASLGHLLDDRLALIDEGMLKKVRELNKKMLEGWVRLHNTLLDKNINSTLTTREREVARLAAYGFSNTEIASRLHVEVSSVKRFVFSAMNKVGAQKRSELGQFI